MLPSSVQNTLRLGLEDRNQINDVHVTLVLCGLFFYETAVVRFGCELVDAALHLGIGFQVHNATSNFRCEGVSDRVEDSIENLDDVYPPIILFRLS